MFPSFVDVHSARRSLVRALPRCKKSSFSSVVAVFATTFVASVAAQSSVTISGKIEASLDHLSIKSAAGSKRTVRSVSSDSSRLIFEGTEDLGGGLRAKFKLDQGFSADTGALGFGGVAFGREAFVGLAGRFGELRLGRNYIPMDDLAAPLDPFYFTGVGAAWPMTFFTPRINNSIKYISPKINGLQLRGLLSPSEGVTGASFNGLGASYSNARFDAHLAYTLQKDGAPTGDRKELLLGGAIKFDGPRLTAMYVQRDDPGAPKRSTALVGVNVPLGLGEVRASYILERQAAAKARKLSVQYVHSLSKRTAVYTGIARLDNNAGFAETINPALPRLANGEDVTAFQVGIRHSF